MSGPSVPAPVWGKSDVFSLQSEFLIVSHNWTSLQVFITLRKMKKGNEPVEIIPKLLLSRVRHLEVHVIIVTNFHLLFLLTTDWPAGRIHAHTVSAEMKRESKQLVLLHLDSSKDALKYQISESCQRWAKQSQLQGAFALLQLLMKM